jgi:hypothetical protein
MKYHRIEIPPDMKEFKTAALLGVLLGLTVSLCTCSKDDVVLPKLPQPADLQRQMTASERRDTAATADPRPQKRSKRKRARRDK